MVSEGESTSLAGFSEPVPFRAENLSVIEHESGVHAIWDTAGELIYAGYTSNQRTRLQQHLTGDRTASVLHDKVGRLLDRELDREATRDEIRSWLEECTVAWKSDPDPQGVKARIIEEFHPRFNEVVPESEANDSKGDVWDEFAYWARYFFETPDFAKNERNYKLRLGQEFSAARTAVLDNNDDWLELLESAFNSRDNNLSRWNQHGQYVEWLTSNSDAAIASLNAIWGNDNLEDAITAWADQTPKEAASGPGTRTMFASLLLLGVDTTVYPPFKPTVLEDGYRLVGHDPGDKSTEYRRYRASLDFFNRIIEECDKRGVQLRDRLDAQGVLWTILKVDLDEVEEPERLAAFRGERYANVWWVNQGQTYEQERDGGYVWAPQRDKRGAVLDHWLNVSKLAVGDVVIHYAKGAIRAISEVEGKGGQASKPDGLGEAWQQEGYRADVEYFDLEDPINLNEIPAHSRREEDGAFNRNGGVNQGYLYSLSTEFAGELFSLFESRWPVGSPWSPFTGNYWVFQGNPDKWDFDYGLARFDETGEGNWTAAQHRREMAEGDRVAIWKSGQEAGVYAMAEIASEPFVRDEGERLTSGSGEEWAVLLRNPELIEPPLLRSEILSDPILGELDVIRIRQGTNFRVSKDQWERMQDLIYGTAPVGSGSLVDVVGSVSGGLLDAGLEFGSGHLGFVRSFVVSLATKGFVLLTGLSGSGKSRLAVGFGEWLGEGRYWVEAVRPDWTGPDALLGFPDGLSVRDDHGRLGWHVPGVLEFMLEAANDGERPYLLS